MDAQFIIIIAVVIILIGYFIYKKRIDEAKKQNTGKDFIITFHNDSYTDIRKIAEFKNIGTFQEYGDSGFRGNVHLKKEELELLIKETLKLNDDDFSIIAPASMYIPHEKPKGFFFVL